MNIGPKFVDLTAGQSLDNLLAGEVHEIMRQNSMVWFAINGDGTGTDVQYSVISGIDSVVQNARCNTKNAMPVWPDDFLISDAAVAGDRLTVPIRNTGAATRRVFYAVRIEPVA